VSEYGGVSVRRYWNCNRRARLDYDKDDDYAEHFRDVFTRAVACRLTSTTGVLLSGGIDSSAVAGVAQSLHAAAGKGPLNAFTVVFRRRECDETSYSNAVVRKWGLTSTRLEAQAPDRAEIEADIARSFDWPAYPNGLAANTLRRRAASMGIDRLLTGFGGDDFYTGVEVDDVRRGFRRLAHLAAGARRLIRTLRASVGGRSSRQPWIRQEFARRVDLADRLSLSPVVSFPTREQEDMYRAATGLVQVLGDEMEERAASAIGLMQRHPFYDRRVAEFGLALPPQQRFDGTHTKAVIRRALADVLPGEVAGRRDKAEFSATYVDALASINAAAIFSRLRSEEAGWVDGDVIRDMYQRMIQLYSRHDDAYIALVEPLWSVAALELWLAGVGTTAD
jgi:asparagine synthase (glutamine-hydrolysing)